jgi:hypothetical protein
LNQFGRRSTAPAEAQPVSVICPSPIHRHCSQKEEPARQGLNPRSAITVKLDDKFGRENNFAPHRLA